MLLLYVPAIRFRRSPGPEQPRDGCAFLSHGEAKLRPTATIGSVLARRHTLALRLGVVWIQRDVRLEPRPRGFHLVTDEVLEAVPELGDLDVGIAHLFLRHTSASLTVNENASPDVRRDFAAWFDRAVPDGAPYFAHTLEGSDDMPAHVKASLTGSALTLPVRGGGLALGTWQGIYLCEHRNAGGPRSLVVTVWGE
jgi:secondary thiamine-phosphate synthase enzyme